MVQQAEVRQFGLRLSHSTCHLAADRLLPRRILQLVVLLLLYCSGFADGSWWRIADLSLDPAHFHRDNRSYELCGDSTFFTDHQRDTCYNNPELLKIIVHAANTAKYECQTYFQNNRWNCSAKRGSGIYYGNFDDKGKRTSVHFCSKIRLCT
uniref:Protein Wnt n=1 Tax=Anopheles maculatus TaxID=74869 RepID=A0A182SXU9_9DIPT